MFSRGLLRRHATFIGQIYLAADLCMVLVAGLVAYLLRFGNLQLPLSYWGVVALCLALTLLIFASLGVNEAWRGRTWLEQLRALTVGWVLVMVTLVVLGFLFKVSAHFSRQWIGYWGIAGWLTLVLGRGGTTWTLMALRRRGWNRKRLLIVGTNDLARDVASRIAEADWSGWEVVGFVDDGSGRHGDLPGAAPVIDGPERIEAFVSGNSVDEVWLCLPLSREALIRDVVFQLRHSTVTQRLIPDLSGIRLMRQPVTEVLGMPAVDLNGSPMRGINRILKGLEDRILSLLILILVSPLMLVIAIAVKFSSPGPVFYRQTRVSWNGEKFSMLKFRSMPVDAEAGTGPVWNSRDRNRATRFGEFLRRTSLDELPQFINVLRGDMSIVGPRPERPVFVEEFKDRIPGYMQKHLVKAGITGWAQVNGWRGNTDLAKRIEHDLYYIENWSLWFDFEIMLMTLYRGFVHRNAY